MQKDKELLECQQGYVQLLAIPFPIFGGLVGMEGDQDRGDPRRKRWTSIYQDAKQGKGYKNENTFPQGYVNFFLALITPRVEPLSYFSKASFSRYTFISKF